MFLHCVRIEAVLEERWIDSMRVYMQYFFYWNVCVVEVLFVCVGEVVGKSKMNVF